MKIIEKGYEPLYDDEKSFIAFVNSAGMIDLLELAYRLDQNVINSNNSFAVPKSLLLPNGGCVTNKNLSLIKKLDDDNYKYIALGIKK